MQTLRPYDAHRKVEILDDLWTLKRKGHTLRVQLRTHPLGWELQALVGGELHRSQVAKTERDVSTVAEQWKAEAFAKGWGEAAL
ncbi:MAG TPA: hypothetical protein VIX35_13840 [Vicinamibacterales bacterium]